MAVTFDDVKPIFARYVGCMKARVVSNDEGAFPCDLSDYETVKVLHKEILYAIDDAWEAGVPVRYQSMPPGNTQLPSTDIQIFKDWIEQGMQES